MSCCNKKNLLKTIYTANAGCGCSTPKSSDVYEPTPIPKTCTSKNSNPSFNDKNGSLSMDIENFTSTTLSFNIDASTLNSEYETGPRTAKPMTSECPKIINSVAVEKDSNDPYKDFYHSMLQMITEKEIYSKNDLQELLKCFLELNSSCHHDVIVQAFMEIYSGFIGKKHV
ncbi:Ovate domain-containing protein [Cephalotus follicularis]|uniref:Transcription repressor n=1 Tax=Cephalotus follicularis TaxID=3775 RepID=A0A1Q3CB54_CEPFO|nr:Ovate domain-containing protein [Cephalotus follicularis]